MQKKLYDDAVANTQGFMNYMYSLVEPNMGQYPLHVEELTITQQQGTAASLRILNYFTEMKDSVFCAVPQYTTGIFGTGLDRVSEIVGAAGDTLAIFVILIFGILLWILLNRNFEIKLPLFFGIKVSSDETVDTHMTEAQLRQQLLSTLTALQDAPVPGAANLIRDSGSPGSPSPRRISGHRGRSKSPGRRLLTFGRRKSVKKSARKSARKSRKTRKSAKKSRKSSKRSSKRFALRFV
jgi:hypothetical protein